MFELVHIREVLLRIVQTVDMHTRVGEQSIGVELLAVPTRLVTEALLMLLVAVAYGVAEDRCGDASAVLDSMAVELIDSGNDPPVTVVLSC